MADYLYDRTCRCTRCRAHGIMGPSVLMTVGVLFLLDNLDVYGAGFNRTWPVILLVIGIVKFFQSSASTDGHVNYIPPPVMNPPPIVGDAARPSGEVQNG